MTNSLTDLFSLIVNNQSFDEEFFSPCEKFYSQQDLAILYGYFTRNFYPDENMRCLLEYSAEAFDSVIYAWMSELPVEKEIIAFGRGVISAAKTGGTLNEKRVLADRAALDRGGNDTLTVLNVSAKVRHEINRMMGLLRFTPDEQNIYTAKCSPDHLIIPALSEYFTARFGETAWAIIDEKRRLSLSRLPPQNAKLAVMETASQEENMQNDEWEELWRHYHKTINNESRNNKDLQRQLMPKRYWKYLPEM